MVVITGFDGVVEALVKVGRRLEERRRVLFIFLDQFENVFFLKDALSRIRDLFVKLVDVQSNVVIGFSWKTDLVGLTNEFPYQIRDTITSTSKRLGLNIFSDVETNILLDRLSEDLRATLRKDLRFFLSEFFSGLPLVAQETLRPRKGTTRCGSTPTKHS